MDKLAIPFAHESFSAFNLVEDERNDVEQQLDERRIAMQQIRDMGHAYGEGDIVIDVDNDTVNTTDGVIAQEANATLAVMVKAILRGVKDYGVANENIVEATISSNDNSCLLKEYACFYSNDGFKMILDALISIGNKVYQGDTETLIENVPSLQKIKELNENGIEENDAGLISGAPVDSNKYLVSIPILDYINNLKDLAENFVFLNRNAREIYRGTNTDATDPEAIDRGTLENWGTQTLSSLEARTSSKFVQLVIDLNKAFTRSLSDLYSQISTSIANYGDEELNDHLNEISDQYSILCSNSEFNLVSERTSALENYFSNLIAIEAFRDSKVGRVINFLFRMVKIAVKTIISYYSVAIRKVIESILKLVSIISTKIVSINIDERKQKIKPLIEKIIFNEDLDVPQFYVTIKEGVIGYDVIIDGLLSRVVRIPREEFNVTTGRVVNIDELDKITDGFVEKELSDGTKKASDTGIYVIKGYVVPLRKIKEVIVVQEDLIGNLRDVIVDFLRDGKDDKLYMYADRTVTMLNIISKSAITKLPKDLNEDFRTIYFRKKCDNYQDILEMLDKIQTLIRSIMDVRVAIPNVDSLFYDEKNNLSELQTIYKSLGVSTGKIEQETKDIERVLARVDGDDDEIAKRAKIAKIYTSVICLMSEFISLSINNSVKLACKLERYKRYSDLIHAKLINSLYKDIIVNKD